MELVIEPYDVLPCELETFTINGKKASSIDFGNTIDHEAIDYEEGEKDAYSCSNIYFEPEPPTEIVLHKYNITEEEYYSICDELENKLHVSRCGWCV